MFYNNLTFLYKVVINRYIHSKYTTVVYHTGIKVYRYRSTIRYTMKLPLLILKPLQDAVKQSRSVFIHRETGFNQLDILTKCKRCHA